MAERRLHSLQRVLGVNELFATAYGNVGSSIYYALGLVASYALGLTPIVFLITGLFFFATAASYAEATAMFPEAGGSSSFARHAFNEYAAFMAAWGQMLNYVITVSVSAYFVPHYLGVLWPALKHAPGDIIGGIIVVILLMTLNIIGTKESAKLNVTLAVVDFCTQVVIVLAGFVLVLSPHTLAQNIHWGTAPTWSQFFLAIPIGMIAYTGIETVSNMAEEAKDERKSIPAAIKRVELAVFAIYFTLPAIALSALPVTKNSSGTFTTQLGLPESQGGYEGDPILGVVKQFHLGPLDKPLQLYVGLLGATILFLAANAGLIGVSRLVYSMGIHRQMPNRLSALHPRFGTPWVGIAVFGSIAIIPILPGKADFLGNLYAFGAMLSFTVAHVSLIALRRKYPDMERPYKSPLSFSVGGWDLPMLAVLGGGGTLIAFAVVAARNLGGISYAGFAWLAIGAITYPIARHRMGLDLKTTVKVEAPEPVVMGETEYESLLVWYDIAQFREEPLVTVSRLASRTKRPISVLITIPVPNSSPIDALMPDAEKRARVILEQARLLTHGRATGEIVRVRAGQEGRVIVDTARHQRARAVVLALPKGGTPLSGNFSRAVETVLSERPCRVIVDTPAPPKAVKVPAAGAAA